MPKFILNQKQQPNWGQRSPQQNDQLQLHAGFGKPDRSRRTSELYRRRGTRQGHVRECTDQWLQVLLPCLSHQLNQTLREITGDLESSPALAFAAALQRSSLLL